MRVNPLNTENVIAYFDEESKIGVVSYEGVLTPQATVVFYKWLDASYETVSPAEYRGGIFDFRQVTEFNQNIIETAQSAAKMVDRHHDLSNIPVAFIVADASQEEMVRKSMGITPQQKRKQIVKNTQEAYDFIDAWHQQPMRS